MTTLLILGFFMDEGVRGGVIRARLGFFLCADNGVRGGVVTTLLVSMGAAALGSAMFLGLAGEAAGLAVAALGLTVAALGWAVAAIGSAATLGSAAAALDLLLVAPSMQRSLGASASGDCPDGFLSVDAAFLVMQARMGFRRCSNAGIFIGTGEALRYSALPPSLHELERLVSWTKRAFSEHLSVMIKLGSVPAFVDLDGSGSSSWFWLAVSLLFPGFASFPRVF